MGVFLIAIIGGINSSVMVEVAVLVMLVGFAMTVVGTLIALWGTRNTETTTSHSINR